MNNLILCCSFFLLLISSIQGQLTIEISSGISLTKSQNTTELRKGLSYEIKNLERPYFSEYSGFQITNIEIGLRVARSSFGYQSNPVEGFTPTPTYPNIGIFPIHQYLNKSYVYYEFSMCFSYNFTDRLGISCAPNFSLFDQTFGRFERNTYVIDEKQNGWFEKAQITRIDTNNSYWGIELGSYYAINKILILFHSWIKST